MGSYNTKPIRKLDFEGYKIFVFNQNLANNLPAWDNSYEAGSSFKATKNSLSHVGKFYENYNNAGAALVAEKGEVGALHYGPFINVEPGTYTVTFDIAISPSSDGAARLDVARGGQKILAETTLMNNTSPYQLSFTLDKSSTIEFRVWSLGNASVIFRSVRIIKNPN